MVTYQYYIEFGRTLILPREVIESAKVKCRAVTQTHARVITHYGDTMLYVVVAVTLRGFVKNSAG